MKIPGAKNKTCSTKINHSKREEEEEREKWKEGEEERD